MPTLFSSCRCSARGKSSDARSYASPVTDDVEFESLADVAEFARIRALVSVLQGYADDTEFKQEGLFRVNGGATEIEEVNRMLNNVDTFEDAVSVLDLMMDGSPNNHRHPIAGAFKSRLRSLPVRIIPFNVAAQLVREYPFNADYVADTIANHIHQTFEDNVEVEEAAMDTIEAMLRMLNAVVDNPDLLMTPDNLKTCLMSALVIEKVIDPKLNMFQVEIMNKPDFSLFKAFLTHGRAIADIISPASDSEEVESDDEDYSSLLDTNYVAPVRSLRKEDGLMSLRQSVKNVDNKVEDLSYLCSSAYRINKQTKEESIDESEDEVESDDEELDTSLLDTNYFGKNTDSLNVETGMKSLRLSLKNSDKKLDSDLSYLSSAMFQMEEPNDKENSKRESSTFFEDTPMKTFRRQGGYLNAAAVARAISESNLEN